MLCAPRITTEYGQTASFPVLTIWTRFCLSEPVCLVDFVGFWAVIRNTLRITDTCQKLHFLLKTVLTCFGCVAYKPLTNEGGGAAGDRRTRSEVSYESLVRIVGLGGNADGSRGKVFDGFSCLFFDN